MLNVPAEVTRLVGRRRELTQAKRALSQARLVTLTGPGGVGKTRLALRMATQLRRAFRDGVCWVDLDGLQDSALVGYAIAEALGLREHDGQWRDQTLTDYLGERRMLLVLDNCEHLVDPCAQLVHHLLRTCSDLSVLVTTRHRLGLPGEAVQLVPPLSTPDPNHLPPPETLARYEAVELFLDRARAAVPELRLTTRDHVTIARLCHVLEGVPLALQLTAVRLRALSPAELLERVTDHCQLLSHSLRGAHARQQSLQASIAWSFQLCSPAERAMWSRLAVFAGDFTLEAAEGICADDTLPTERILFLIGALLDQSILTREPRHGQARYRLPEALRQYGRHQLRQSDEWRHWRRRHRDYYADLVAEAGREWLGPRQAQWAARLGQEHTNLAAALSFSLADPDQATVSLRMATGLVEHWLLRGELGEARHWLGRALAHDSGPPDLRLRALVASANFATWQGKLHVAAEHIDTAARLLRQVDDAPGQAYLTQARGLLAVYQGDFPRARDHLEQTLPILQTAGDSIAQARSLNWLALITGLSGDTDDALRWHEQSLALTEPLHEHWFQAFSLWAKGVHAWQHGDHPHARMLLTNCLRLAEAIDNRMLIANAFDALAWLAETEGNHQRAATLLGTVERITTTLTVPFRNISTIAGYHDQAQQAARANGERAYQQAFHRGYALTQSEAITFASEDTLPRPAPPTAADARRNHDAHLTHREQQVTHLIAQGMSNKEIAATLVISQRTAETHVEHVLSKLGFHSRAQIAAWTTQHHT